MTRNEIRPRNNPDRLVLRKYDRVAGRHVDFREVR
ncbi:50S ribosomal protein L33 [Streptomyces sp. NPDC058286]